MKHCSIFGMLLSLSLPLIAGVEQEYIFDIHDATSTAEYGNDALLIPVYQSADNDLTLSDNFAEGLPELHTKLPALLRARSFKATNNNHMTFTDIDDAGNAHIIIASALGSSTYEPLPLEAFRRCFARALREAERNQIATVHIALPSCIAAPMKQIAQEIATITHLALYEYNLKSVKTSRSVKRICVHAHMQTPQEFKDVNIGLRIGTNLGVAICQARDWINAPSNIMTPTALAAQAEQFVLPFVSRIETVIFEKEDLKRMGMGGLLSVSQGSNQPCALVMHYLKARRPNAPTIALIGKGLTYNAGGLNVKTDMSGAAAVLTALQVLTYRSVPVNILVLAPLAENVVNGSALKPGDVVTLYNGNSVEVLNAHTTDALPLADAITYAIKNYHPDYIIDIGTLSDSCMYALGNSYAAIMGNSNFLIDHVQQAAANTGEAVWHLPLTQEYAAYLASDIADLRTLAYRNHSASTQIAACFLQTFVGTTPWLHIDIAGAKHAQEYHAKGHPAFGVRLLVELVELLAQSVQYKE